MQIGSQLAATDSREPASRRMRAPWAVVTVLGVALIAAASAWFSASLAERRALADITETAQERMSLYASSLRNAVRRHDYLPIVLARDHDVLVMLQAQGDESLRDRVNRKLEAVNRAAGAAALYVVDRSGVAIASSNWNEPESFVGSSYAFRPYFRDALANGHRTFLRHRRDHRRPGLFSCECGGSRRSHERRRSGEAGSCGFGVRLGQSRRGSAPDGRTRRDLPRQPTRVEVPRPRRDR